MKRIDVFGPPPEAFNKHRPPSDLIKAQVRHMQHLEARLPEHVQNKFSARDLATENGAAKYIAHITAVLCSGAAEAQPPTPTPLPATPRGPVPVPSRRARPRTEPTPFPSPVTLPAIAAGEEPGIAAELKEATSSAEVHTPSRSAKAAKPSRSLKLAKPAKHASTRRSSKSETSSKIEEPDTPLLPPKPKRRGKK